MQPPKKLLHAAFDGTGVDLSTGTYEMLFFGGGSAPDYGDTGYEFEDDITGDGHTIHHREVLTNPDWTARVFSADSFVINDPGSGTVTHVAVIRQGGGGAGTNRIICHQDIADFTFDSVDDQGNVDASGFFRLGTA